MKISYDLYDTVEQNPHIKEVYFTKENQHYFNKHELDGKSYGFLKTEQVKSHVVGDKQFFKMVQVANPSTLIVETLSRKEILKMDPVDETEIFSTFRSSRARAEEKKKLAAATAEKTKKEPAAKAEKTEAVK